MNGIGRLLRRLYAKAYSLAFGYSKRHSRKGLYENLTRAILTYPVEEGSTQLNIGAGGDVQDVIQSAGVTVVSVDIDPARQPDIVASATDLSMFETGSIAQVFCLEVLEHLPSPPDAAEEIHRILKPGGTVIGSTPFILGIHDRPHDYYRFTKMGLQHLFRKFDELELVERNSYIDSSLVLPLRLIVTGSERDQRKILLRLPLIWLTFWWFRLLFRGIQNEDATTGYFFVFRKPGTQ